MQYSQPRTHRSQLARVRVEGLDVDVLARRRLLKSRPPRQRQRRWTTGP